MFIRSKYFSRKNRHQIFIFTHNYTFYVALIIFAVVEQITYCVYGIAN